MSPPAAGMGPLPRQHWACPQKEPRAKCWQQTCPSGHSGTQPRGFFLPRVSSYRFKRSKVGKQGYSSLQLSRHETPRRGAEAHGQTQMASRFRGPSVPPPARRHFQGPAPPSRLWLEKTQALTPSTEQRPTQQALWAPTACKAQRRTLEREEAEAEALGVRGKPPSVPLTPSVGSNDHVFQ